MLDSVINNYFLICFMYHNTDGEYAKILVIFNR